MDPIRPGSRTCSGRLPHPRGDGPATSCAGVTRSPSPPPAWGWTRPGLHRARPVPVSPTRVGMDPPPSTAPRWSSRLPHPRGDGPGWSLARRRTSRSPPPAWGWTRERFSVPPAVDVSPTRVGMDPPRCCWSCRAHCLPHPRGDGPGPIRHRSALPWVSPTRVGMDPLEGNQPHRRPGLPHPRGDGPWSIASTSRATTSPPPAWGWTRAHLPDPRRRRVSPTRVGMDPVPRRSWAPHGSLPHPRGDGPEPRPVTLTSGESPPPAWGWTLTRALQKDNQQVSPTRVGMDPTHTCAR